MAARAEDAAAPGRVVTARFPFREAATIVGVVFTATGALIAGMQWAISINIEPLHGTMREMQAQMLVINKSLGELSGLHAGLHDEVGRLRTEVEALGGLSGEVSGLRSEVREVRAEVESNRDQIAENRAEIVENRRQIVDLRERMAKVETGLDQVQANQVRMLEILERGPPPGE